MNDDELRFFAKVEKTDACWLWTAAKNNMGYGVFSVGGSLVLAHRFSYERNVGPIASGLTLDHLCRVPLCVNPEHLEPVTHAENVARGEGGKMWREKTHCPKGHPYEGYNLIVTKAGYRACRECNNERGREYRRKKKETLR